MTFMGRWQGFAFGFARKALVEEPPKVGSMYMDLSSPERKLVILFWRKKEGQGFQPTRSLLDSTNGLK